MAPERMPAHTRTDSVVNGVDIADSVSKTHSIAQNFRAAITAFTSEDGFQALAELLELLPQREKDIERQDGMIRDLQSKLGAQEASHSEFAQKQLSAFAAKYDDWDEENTDLQEKITELEAALTKKDLELKSVHAKFAECEAKNDDLERAYTQATACIKDKDQQLMLMNANLQKTRADADSLKEKLKRSNEEIIVLKESMKDEQDAHQTLKEKAAETSQMLKSLTGLSVKLKNLNVSEIKTDLDNLWKSATQLIEKYFGQNLPDSVLQIEWTKMRDNDVFKHQMLIPQSNSTIAKQTRIAVTVGTLARLVDWYIFQPTYLLEPESGLRKVLCRQALVDSMKERYTRGILLTMDQDEQHDIIEDSIEYVVEKMLDEVNVSLLLTEDAQGSFVKDLRSFLSQCHLQWSTIQRGKQKIETNFKYFPDTGSPCHVFDAQAADNKNGTRAKDSLTTDHVEDNVVILPRFYLFSTGAEPDPITCGHVFRKADRDAAAEEARKGPVSTPFGPHTSTRHRHRTNRTMSMSGHTALAGERAGPFLS